MTQKANVVINSNKVWAVAFTDEQNRLICRNLIREARCCGVTVGMRKTTVEQLANAVGISKGSFYKFFDSKELLFFAMLEDIHTECFAAAQNALQENAALLPAGRAAVAILAACRWLSEAKAFVFIENDGSFSCTDCRRRSKRLTTTMTRRTSAHCWKRAVCSQRAAWRWRLPWYGGSF